MSEGAGDVVAMANVVLKVDDVVRPTALRCVGRLDRRTRHRLIAAVEEMLRGEPGAITIDVEKLRLMDGDAANALTQVQRMVRQSGVLLRWQGLRPDHLRPARSFDHRAGAGRPGARTPARLGGIPSARRARPGPPNP